MTNIIRAERATIEFCDGLNVDGYRMPDGEFRVGITSASLVAGFAENYLRRLLDQKSGTRFKALQSTGFSQQIEKVVRASKTGDIEERTISLKDFVRFLQFSDKPQAGAILTALVENSLNDFFRDAFGEKPLTIEDKRVAFYLTYAASINWLEEDKIDRDALKSWG
jgi:hypothetical protein